MLLQCTITIENLCIIVTLCFCAILYVDAVQTYTTLPEFEETWLENSLRDIAYYLRNHKFNEWDRRHYETKPAHKVMGFYEAFPIPSLKYIHAEVYKNCHNDFIICINYLHRIITTAPFIRTDDITTSLNKGSGTLNITSLRDQNHKCIKALLYAEKTGLPFDGPEEKFYWRTSASYYMCWYTMKEHPVLSMLGESCDNFASCFHMTYGKRNRDPRSNDKLPFACAMYSFCPDPCCPSKHVYTLSECYKSRINPCYIQNVANEALYAECSFNRKANQNLEQMIENKWNVSCHCQQEGFIWDSQFGMCVDIDECATEQHECNKVTEDCLNLPGTYECVCKLGYEYHRIKQSCVEQMFVLTRNEENDDDLQVGDGGFSSLWGYLLGH